MSQATLSNPNQIASYQNGWNVTRTFPDGTNLSIYFEDEMPTRVSYVGESIPETDLLNMICDDTGIWCHVSCWEAGEGQNESVGFLTIDDEL